MNWRMGVRLAVRRRLEGKSRRDNCIIALAGPSAGPPSVVALYTPFDRDALFLDSIPGHKQIGCLPAATL